MRVVCVLVIALLSTVARGEELRVAAAASLREVITEIAGKYERERAGGKVLATYGSSGQLAAQVKAGAPIDVFISAAQTQVADLVNAKLADGETRMVIATNNLVLVAPPTNPDALVSLDSLKTLHGRLAVGQPDLVPAGLYARQVLAFMKLETLLKPKLIFAANVRQVLAYVERGEVAAGFVYATDARESGDKVKVIAAAPAVSHDPIVYPAIVISASTKKTEAQVFLNFLRSESAKAVFVSKGFTVP